MLTVRIFVLITATASVASSRVNQIAMDGLLSGLEKDSVGGVTAIFKESVKGYEANTSRQNQDRALSMQSGELTLLAVFDGHGDEGEKVSQALHDKFEGRFKHFVDLQAAVPKNATTKTIIESLKDDIQTALNEVDAGVESGGSTALIALVLSDQVLVATPLIKRHASRVRREPTICAFTDFPNATTLCSKKALKTG